MKAVNLVPADQRRGGGSARGKSGGAVYGLLGALAILVLVASLTAPRASRSPTAARRLEQLRAARPRPPSSASPSSRPTSSSASSRQQRVATVDDAHRSSRFDWAHALREVSRVVPADASMTALKGTTAPGISLAGADSVEGGGRDAVQAPAIEVTGCVPSLARVATFMARLRTIDDVDKVSLGATEKSDTVSSASVGSGASASASGASGNGDCRQGSGKVPRFGVVVFFKPTTGATAAPTESKTSAKANQQAATAAVGATTPAGGAE